MKRALVILVFVLQGCSSGSELQWRPPSTEAKVSVADEQLGWSDIQVKLFKPRCLSCHGPGNEKGLIDLSDPKVVRNSIGTIFFMTVVVPVMPPPEANQKVSREQMLQLSSWIADGTPTEAGGEAERGEEQP